MCRGEHGELLSRVQSVKLGKEAGVAYSPDDILVDEARGLVTLEEEIRRFAQSQPNGKPPTDRNHRGHPLGERRAGWNEAED